MIKKVIKTVTRRAIRKVIRTVTRRAIRKVGKGLMERPPTCGMMTVFGYSRMKSPALITDTPKVLTGRLFTRPEKKQKTTISKSFDQNWVESAKERENSRNLVSWTPNKHSWITGTSYLKRFREKATLEIGSTSK